MATNCIYRSIKYFICFATTVFVSKTRKKQPYPRRIFITILKYTRFFRDNYFDNDFTNSKIKLLFIIVTHFFSLKGLNWFIYEKKKINLKVYSEQSWKSGLKLKVLRGFGGFKPNRYRFEFWNWFHPTPFLKLHIICPPGPPWWTGRLNTWTFTERLKKTGK